MTYLFTSESVSEGHPDKVCDQISDAVLDTALRQDPNARVAAETFAANGLVLIGGEITANAEIDFQVIARNVLKEIGYDDAENSIDYKGCAVLTAVSKQSPDIAQGVNEGEGLFKEMGAGDQGMMFGYACTQTPELMPLPLSLAHKLVKKLAELRKSAKLPYLRPDAKSQVTVEYEGTQPVRVHTVVISTQHSEDVAHGQIEKDVIQEVIREVIPAKFLDAQTKFYVNPTGRFVIGGPKGDTGLTGRKIIVDTYGGWACHGGGAFSGKDPSKVDRSGAYMGRYIAKNMVAAGLADELEVQLAYAIGVAQPISVRVNTRGTAKCEESYIETLIRAHFNLTPAGIIKELNLKQPIYQKTAAYGHFGRDDLQLPWEKTDKAEAIKEAAKKTAVTR